MKTRILITILLKVEMHASTKSDSVQQKESQVNELRVLVNITLNLIDLEPQGDNKVPPELAKEKFSWGLKLPLGLLRANICPTRHKYHAFK